MALSSRTTAAFSYAAGCAQGYWPAVDKFELIGSDAQYGNQRVASMKIPPGYPAIVLKQAAVVLEFAATGPLRQDPDEPIV